MFSGLFRSLGSKVLSVDNTEYSREKKVFISGGESARKGFLKSAVSFLCVCPVIDHEFRHNIVKVVVNPRGDSRGDSQTTLTML